MQHQRVRDLHVPRRRGDADLPDLWQPSAVPGVRGARPLTARQATRRPAVRRDAEGGYRIGPTWESLTERLIREAQEAGGFDDLPGRGRRLELDDDPREGELGLAFHILRTNGAVPPWIAADMEARRCADAIERLMADASCVATDAGITPMTRSRLLARLRRLIDEHDHAVEALAACAPSVAVHRRHQPRAVLEERLERALGGDHGTAPRP